MLYLQKVFAVCFFALVLLDFLANGSLSAIAMACALALSMLTGVLLERKRETQ